MYDGGLGGKKANLAAIDDVTPPILISSTATDSYSPKTPQITSCKRAGAREIDTEMKQKRQETDAKKDKSLELPTGTEARISKGGACVQLKGPCQTLPMNPLTQTLKSSDFMRERDGRRLNMIAVYLLRVKLRIQKEKIPNTSTFVDLKKSTITKSPTPSLRQGKPATYNQCAND